MPLPPALLNKLKQRGIIKAVENQEEIIAENYDPSEDRSLAIAASLVARDGDAIIQLPSSLFSSGAPGCPNKYNPYHLCCEYCFDHWGDGRPEHRLDPEYQKRRTRMLKKYPLPTFWKEIYDPGSGRYYYWNLESDEVCWLSPTHPKARPGQAACKLAKMEWDKINKSSSSYKKAGKESSRKQKLSSDESGGSELEEEEEKRRPTKKRGGKLSKSGKHDLDPMDPASYSDVPRGKWATGLETYADAKTGVDTTASGPLFQQRPYPAPGAILRQNMEVAKKKRRE